MKTKFIDWLLKIVSYDEFDHRVVTYLTDEYQHVVKHINVLDSTKEEVLRYAQSLRDCLSVCIYRLEDVL